MSRLNRNRSAFKHGVYAEHTILPGESVEEFDALHRQLVAEFKPDGPLEADHVRSIAEVLWRKRRLSGLRRTPRDDYVYVMDPLHVRYEPGKWTYAIKTSAPHGQWLPPYAPPYTYHQDELLEQARLRSVEEVSDASAEDASAQGPALEDVMEQFRLHAQLDIMIERHMRQLGRAKLYKRELIPADAKTINATPQQLPAVA